MKNEEVIEHIDKILSDSQKVAPEHNAYYVLYDGLIELKMKLRFEGTQGSD